jgi:hypothetical protein
MQAVLAQTTAAEKVNPAHESQDMNMRHFALLAQEARVQQRSSVQNPEQSGKAADREPHKDRKPRAETGGEGKQGEDSSDPEKCSGSLGNLIDITV